MNIFISHSSQNAPYGAALVEFLKDIGVPHERITFTSDPAHGIPVGENIFKWLKGRISEKPFVIYLLSPEYYDSVACLNEMGAAWIVESEHVAIFTPNFDFSDKQFQSGVLDPREMAFAICDEERMAQFAEKLMLKYNSDQLFLRVRRALEKLNKHLKAIADSQRQIAIPSPTPPSPAKSNSPPPPVVNTPPATPQQPTQKPSKSNDPVSNFLADLASGKLRDDEVMLLFYASDTGRIKLGVGWKEQEEITRIKEWEEFKGFDAALSHSYEKGINRLDLRRLTTVSEYTSGGNPRLIELVPEAQGLLLDMPPEFHDRVQQAVDAEKQRVKALSAFDDIPF